MLTLTQKEQDLIGHYMAGLYTLTELNIVLWDTLKTCERLPNGKLLIECRRTQTKRTV